MEAEMLGRLETTVGEGTEGRGGETKAKARQTVNVRNRR